MANLTPEVMDIVKMKAQTSGVKEELIAKYYEKFLGDPQYTADFPNQKDLIDYISMLVEGHINQWLNQRIETFDLIVIGAQKIIPKKEGKSTFCKYLAIGTMNSEGGQAKFKKLVITHFSDEKKLKALDMLHISLKVQKEVDDTTLDCIYDTELECTPTKLSWVPDPKEFVRTQLQKNVTTILDAGHHLSGKEINNGNTGYTKPFELRLLRGVVEGVFGTRLNLIDNSVEKHREFMKNTQVQDPKDPTKTKIKYGGFTVFCDEEQSFGKNSLIDAIGYINDAHTMSAWAILPVKTIAKQKPSERLQKPGQQQAQPPQVLTTDIGPTTI
jgi:hypothetical protein